MTMTTINENENENENENDKDNKVVQIMRLLGQFLFFFYEEILSI